MATWGSQTWGYENWGTLGDVNVELSGQSTLSSSVGSVEVQQVPGWGTQYWGAGEWGDLKSPEVSLTGQVLNTTLDSVTLQADANVTVTSLPLSIVKGSELAGTSAEVPLTALNEIQTFTGNEFAGEVVVVEVSSPSNDEWGTEYWGAGQWGVGDGVTIALGQETVTGDANVEVSGEQIAFQNVGETVIPVILENGLELQSSQGDAFGGELVEVQVSTASAAPWGYAPFGEGQWGQGIGTDISIGGEEVAVPSVEVPVNNTNLTINSFANNQPTITADANILQTGEELTTVLGNEDAVPNTQVDLTGVEISFTLQGVVAGASADVEPTGVTATTSTGIIGLNAWELVDPGTAPTWTVVDKAA